LAYVIFTSGSTGVPKGAMVAHQGMLNHLFAKIGDLGLTSVDVVAQTASQCFDISIWQLLAVFLVGGRVEIFPNEIAQSPSLLLDEARRSGVTILETVPSLLRALVEEVAPGAEADPASVGSLRWMIPTGEALPLDLCNRWLRLFPHVPLLNAYGPTECSDDVAHCVLRRPLSAAAVSVPIGRPVANLRLYVVSRTFHPQPLGVPGELCAGGVAVGRGYLNDPLRTAAVFVPDPFSEEPGARLYRTGDLARWLPAGELEFLGRIDHQVKIRGFRIELGEIEAALARHLAVRECVVAAREDAPGSRYLAAYVVPRGEAPPAADLVDFLRRSLPDSMVPAAFVVLPALPLTPNGKVDRKALPAPERSRHDGAGYVPPGDPVEELLAGLWAEVLGLEKIGVHDNFFELGGHSLLATQVRSRLRGLLGVDLPLRTLFEAPTLGRLAEAVRAAREEEIGGAPAAIPPLPPEARAGDLPLSFAQQRLWLIDQLDPGSSAYNLPTAVRLTGRLDQIDLRPGLLEGVFAALVDRHESLRTTFPARAGRPVQVVAPAAAARPPELPVVDLSALPEGRREELARALARDEARRPFDLERGPLLRLRLFGLGAGDHLLVMTIHHIVSDGWSWGVLLRDIGALAAGSPLPELPVQYADFAVWQRSWLQGEVLETQLTYWRQQLAGAPHVLELPTDRPRPAMPPHLGGTRRTRLPRALLDDVQALCRRRGVTPFMALLASWAVLLGRQAHQDDVLVGTPVAGRNQREVEDLIGFFVNTLVIRVRTDRELSFSDLLVRVREVALDAFTHQSIPFERLVDEVAPDRDLRRPPVFQVMFAMQNAPLGALELPGLTLTQLPAEAGAAKFDLTLNAMETAGGLHILLEYDADLFDATTMERHLVHWKQLLEDVVAAPERSLDSLPLLPEAELHQVLVEHNDTAAAYPEDACIHELILARAARTPEAIAVAAAGETLSYGELAERALWLARRLAELGVGPDVPVGLCAHRSPVLLVALLGVLAAGGAYVPLDPTHPRDRLGYILDDSGASVLLTEVSLLDALPPHRARVVLLDEEIGRGTGGEGHPENLAYVIYTSGSTGRPKGVEVCHRGVVAYLATMAARPGLGAGDVMMAVTTLSFDIAVTELLLPLTVGARLELVSRDTAGDAALLAAAIEAAGATCMQATPATWALLVGGGWAGRPGLKALCGGEALPRALADKLLPRVGELWNVYGPTETTVWSALLRVEPGDRAVPVGFPLGNETLHVLTPRGGPAPLGVSGELAIGGAGLARGYHGRADLTAERFIPDQRQPGARLYRTGDLARRLPDGTLEFLGRIDHQVKVRGFRIELGEIEAVLATHPAVRECAVVARQDGPADKMLVGYVVPAGDGAPEGAELHAFLGEKLPAYMIPAAFVTLAALPLSPAGKVDRKALPAPTRERAARGDDAPRTPAEQAIARIWEEILGVSGVGTEDNFFALGGDSILTVQVVFRAHEAGLALTARDLFRTRNLAELAAVAAEASGNGAAAEEVPAAPALPAARISRRDLDKVMARVAGRRR